MSELWSDVRYALRTLRNAPGYSALSILTLALGIGATSAIFSMVNGALLRRLPYAADGRLVRLEQSSATAPNAAFSVPEVQDLRTKVPELEAVSEYHSMPFQIYGYGDPQRVQTGVVSDNFFALLGVRPLLGRLFTRGEEAAGAPPVVLLSYRYWMDRMGADPGVVGKTFTMNDHVHTIVGVLPPLPAYPDANDIWMPAGACPFRSSPQMMSARRGRMLEVFARLKDGLPPGQGERAVKTLHGQLAQAYPDAYPADAKMQVAAIPLREELTRSSRTLFLTLLATAFFVLVVAGANFANLTLARQLRRDHEFALREALGAGRGRVFRQVATESVVVSVAGALLGIGVAYGSLGLLRSFAGRVSPRSEEIGMDVAVLGLALGAAVLVGLVAAVGPVVRRRTMLADALRQGASAVMGGRGRARVRQALVAAQVVMATILLTGAGLMTRSLVNLQAVDGGYDHASVLTARVDLNWSRYTSPAHARAFADGLMTRLEGRPGLVSLALASDFPMNNDNLFNRPVIVRGEETSTSGERPQAQAANITPAYFTTLGIPLLRGRAFTAADRDTANVPAVINRRLAEARWPGQDPIGKELSISNGRRWLTVVGVVGDVKQNQLSGEVSDMVYLPYFASPTRDFRVLARVRGDPTAMIAPIREAVRALDDKQPVTSVQTMERLRGERLAEPRTTTILLAMFAAIALMITAAGVGGVVAHYVDQRRAEIGIRVALGAEPGRVLGLVLRQGMVTVVLGMVLGVAAALAAGRVLAGRLYGVAPTDPATHAAVIMALLAVGALACLVPARRALGVQPTEALRARG